MAARRILRILKRDGIWRTTKRLFARLVARTPLRYRCTFSFYRDTRLTFAPSLLTYNIFAHRRYRMHDITVLERYLKPGSTMIDVGANMGNLTIAAAALVGPSGRVLAFEPSPRFAEIIQKNLEANAFTDRATVHCVALGAQAGTVHLDESAADDTTNHISENGTAVEEAPLDSFTADLSHIDVLKIDVEGYELEVLRGGHDTLRKTKTIYIELNTKALVRAGVDQQQLYQLLTTYFTLHSKADGAPFQFDAGCEYNTDLVGQSTFV